MDYRTGFIAFFGIVIVRAIINAYRNNFLTLEDCQASCPLSVQGDIPAESSWGLVAMTLLVLSLGTVMVRERRGLRHTSFERSP